MNYYSIDTYLKAFESKNFSVSQIWNIIKEKHNFSSFYNENGTRTTILDLIKKFCEFAPVVSIDRFNELNEYFSISLRDDVSVVSEKKLLSEFRYHMVQYFYSFKCTTILEALQAHYIQLYSIEIIMLGSCIIDTTSLMFDYSNVKICDPDDNINLPPTLLIHDSNMLWKCAKNIKSNQNRYRQKQYDKINLKLISKKYPSLHQPLQYIVSKYL
jgi:hypothetical protein